MFVCLNVPTRTARLVEQAMTAATLVPYEEGRSPRWERLYLRLQLEGAALSTAPTEQGARKVLHIIGLLNSAD